MSDQPAEQIDATTAPSSSAESSATEPSVTESQNSSSSNGTAKAGAGSFEPKYAVTINARKEDEYTVSELAAYDGVSRADKACWVAIKGEIFDVSGKDVYAPGGSYAAFAGKDASRALAQSSLDPNEVRPDYEDLAAEHKKVLEQWFTFFTKRYSVMGKVVAG